MLSQQQVQTARANLGVTPASGGSVDRVSQFKQAMSSPSPSTPSTDTIGAETAKQALGGAEKIGSSVAEGAQKFAATPEITPGGGTPIKKAIGAEAQKTGALLETGLGTAVGAAQSIFAPFTAVLQKLTSNSGGTKSITAPAADAPAPLRDWANAHPEAAKNLMDALTLATAAAGGETAPLTTDLGEGVGVAKQALGDLHDGISNLLESKDAGTAANEATSPGGLVDKVQAYLGKENVDPRLEASAKRLEDPVAAYKQYAEQAKQSMADVKVDAPIAKVGENIGDAYDSVVQTRRGVGKAMAEELSKVKDNPIDVSGSVSKFKDELSTGFGKMTSFDRQQVGTYLRELNALGENPTAGKLDDFLSRVPQELDVAKASKNITDVTNADRIIKGSLSDIRKSLSSEPGMEAYSAARTAYSNLSDFLDEGSRYLGGKPKGGDYARDVSVAKSAAESILGGGKKDWLMKLEGLTGYKALDDATLAIQAMKDAGDTRGLSLFKSLGEGGIPSSPKSVFSKLIHFGAKKVAGKVVGSPADQTTAFLRTIKSAVPK